MEMDYEKLPQREDESLAWGVQRNEKLPVDGLNEPVHTKRCVNAGRSPPLNFGRSMRTRTSMRILLTNDDGLDAPGIEALFDALQGLGEIVPIAPRTVQSATSHGITFHEPLMCQEVVVNDRMTGIAVEG